MIIYPTEKAKTFVHVHNESMKLVERLLNFLAIANIALLGFSRVDNTVGLSLAFSFLFVFFGFGFWWCHSTIETWNILYEDVPWTQEKKSQADGFTDVQDRYSGLASTLLIACTIGSASFLFLALLDQFIPENIIPTPTSRFLILAFITVGVVLFLFWITCYLRTTKSLEDFRLKKAKTQ